MTWEHGYILCALLLFICFLGLASACIEWALEKWGKG